MKREESGRMDMFSFALGFFVGAYATCLVIAVLIIRKVGFRIAEAKKLMEKINEKIYGDDKDDSD